MGRDLASFRSPPGGRVRAVDARRHPGGVAAVDPPLVLTLFGGFSLAHDGRSLAVRSRKAQALLAFLAIGGSAVVSRERLCGLLWSESSEEKARASLRQTVHALKDVFDRSGCSVLQAGRDEVGLSGSWTTDAADVLERLGADEVDPRLLGRKRLADTLLPDFDDVDPSFRVWILVQRQAVGEQLTRALERLLGTADRSPDLARDAAAALLNLDPTHEGACRHAMQDSAARGDVAAALKTYKRLWDLLDEEYGTEPSEQTQALVVGIKTGDIPPRRAEERIPARPEPEPAPATTAKGPLDDHTFLIVSAFDGRGVGEPFLHLVGGLRHELIAKLVRFREWSVLDGGGPPVDVGSLPGRCFSIDATLRQAGASLSLTLTIKEQPAGRYLWSESFAIAQERWFDIEPSLLRRIAMAVNVHLSTERLARTARAPDISLGAYERWLRGQQLLLSFRADDWDRSETIFQSIVHDAPSFSPAYSGLSQLRNTRHLALPGVRWTPDAGREALRFATMAVERDPFHSRSHLAHGWAQVSNQLWDRAEAAIDLALKLNENDPWTLISSALVTAFCGKHNTAVELAEQSLALMPEPPQLHWAYHATLRFVCSDYAGSADASERAEGAISNVSGWHAAALAHLAERARARERVDLFLTTMRSRWHGDTPTDADILEWFLGAFPIRLDADRARLLDGLMRARRQAH